ncbi:unnamed protein product [Coccothraustes coccothraustes]
MQAGTRSGTGPSVRSLLRQAGELLLPPAPAASSAARKPLGLRHVLQVAHPAAMSRRRCPLPTVAPPPRSVPGRRTDITPRVSIQLREEEVARSGSVMAVVERT